MAVDLLLGLQWGDEGKGKIVDVLTTHYDIIARFQGGPNAGHTLEFDGIKHVLHTIPSGIFHPTALNLIGNGVVIDPAIFKKEIEGLQPFNLDIANKLLISKKAHLILPTHRLLDAASEAAKGKGKIGSTLKGIGPTYMDKTGRNGIRVGDILTDQWEAKYQLLKEKHLKLLAGYPQNDTFDLKALEAEFMAGIAIIKSCKIVDSEQFIHEAQAQGKKILAEGAQGSLLDIDFGTYPYVTSSTTTAAGACTGLGVAPNQVKEVLGIFKAYATRVGSGPFPTELFDENGAQMAKVGHEFGATTGRPRRCGWIDLVALKYAIMLSGVDELCMMKADCLSGFDEVLVGTSYKGDLMETNEVPFDLNVDNFRSLYESHPGWKEDITQIKDHNSLPQTFKNYIQNIEQQINTPISIISVGPGRDQTIKK